MTRSTPGIIAAGHKSTAQAGQRILTLGGNAFDAAVAAAFVSFIAEPSLTSFGGGGFMTAFNKYGKSLVYDFFVQTPQVRRKMDEVEFILSQINFGTTVQEQYIGRGSVAVPGCPAGLFHIHEQLGRLPLHEILAPAIELGREGLVVTPYQSYTISILEPIMLYSEASRAVFAIGDRLIKEGEWMTRPKFADTLEYLGKEGVRDFYEGDIAKLFIGEQETYGSLTMEDLRNYQVRERTPVKYNYREHTLLTNSPPSAGGSMISYGLASLSDQTLGEPIGAKYVQTLADVMRRMDQFRKEHLQAKLGEGFRPDAYFQPDFVNRQNKKINWLGNTTQISVMDAEGNAASITTTIGGASGFMIPETGIPLNNMLGELDLNPGGMYAWRENVRVSSMMAPSIMLHEGKPKIVLGSGGSSRIRTAILQVLVNMIDHGMKVGEAVRYPRLHWENNILNIEPELVENLEKLNLDDTKIIPWVEKNMFFGGVHTVIQRKDGALAGEADSRRDGTVLMSS